jgi:hypothetical protein
MSALSFQGRPGSQLQYRPAPYRPASLGQAPALSDTLTPEVERAYQTLTPRDKYLVLTGYQWLAAMTSQGLLYAGEPYVPFLPIGTEAALSFLDSTRSVMSALTAPLAALLSQFGVEMGAAPAAQADATAVLSSLRNVRNRVVKDLTDAGGVVELEYYGDLPGFPGEVVYRKVASTRGGLNAPADFSALFATQDPAALLESGLKLKAKYEEIGAEPKEIKYSMGISPAIIVGAIFAAVVLILGILFIVKHFGFQEKVFERTIAETEKLPPEQRAEVLKNAQNATAIWSQMFRWLEGIPWVTIALIAGGAAAFIWGVPAIIGAFRSGPRTEEAQ